MLMNDSSTLRRRILAAAAAFTVPRWARAQTAEASAQIAQMARPDREAVLAEGARREGELSVYTSLTAEEIGALAAPLAGRLHQSRRRQPPPVHAPHLSAHGPRAQHRAGGRHARWLTAPPL